MRIWVCVGLVACGRLGFDANRVADGSSVADSTVVDTSTATPRWELVQAVGGAGSTVALAPTRPGSLLLVAENHQTQTPDTMVSDDGMNTYAAVPGAAASNADVGRSIDLFFVATATPGVTAITIATASVNPSTVVWEVANLGPLDVAAAISDGARTMTPAGPMIATTHPGEFVASMAIVSTNISGISPGDGFTSDVITAGDGYAHLADPSAPAGSYQATWDAPPVTYAATTVAFLVAP